MTEQYRIAWQSLTTDETGKGTDTFAKAQADKIVEGLNKKIKAITFRVEPVNTYQPKCLECGDTGRSYPTLQNPDGEVCQCVTSR